MSKSRSEQKRLSLLKVTPLIQQTRFAKNDDKEILDLKQVMIRKMSEPASFQEFREILMMADKASAILPPLLLCLKAYFNIQNMIASSKSVPLGAFLELPDKSPAINSFLGFAADPPLVKKPTKEINGLLLRFYSTFMAPEPIVSIAFLKTPTRDTVSRAIINSCVYEELSTNILDQMGEHCLDVIFWECFPKYLLYIGDADKMHKITMNQKKWRQFMSDTDSPVSTPSSARSIKSFFSSSSSIRSSKTQRPHFQDSGISSVIWYLALYLGLEWYNWSPTKQCFVDCITTPKMYAKLKAYAKEIGKDHYLMAIEAFRRLDLIQKPLRSNGEFSEPYFMRFLGQVSQQTPTPVTLSLLPSFLSIKENFLDQESGLYIPCDAAITNSIDTQLKGLSSTLISPDIYDKFIDHTLQAAYKEVFLPMVRDE